MKKLIDVFSEALTRSEGNVQLYHAVLEKGDQFFKCSESLAYIDPIFEHYDFLVDLQRKLLIYVENEREIHKLHIESNLNTSILARLKRNFCYGFFTEFIDQLEQVQAGQLNSIAMEPLSVGITQIINHYHLAKQKETFVEFLCVFTEFYFLLSYLIYQSNCSLSARSASLRNSISKILHNGKNINSQLISLTGRIQEINMSGNLAEKTSAAFVDKFSNFETIVMKNSESFNKFKKEVEQMNFQVSIMQEERKSLNELCEKLCTEYETCLQERKSKRIDFDEQSKAMLYHVEYQAARNLSIEKATSRKKQMENICYTLQAQRNNAIKLLRKYKELIDPKDIKRLAL